MTIGGNLKKLRVAQGLTQDQLAEKLHVTRQAVSNWSGTCPTQTWTSWRPSRPPWGWR